MSGTMMRGITVVDIPGDGMARAVAQLHLKAFTGYLNARLGVGYASALITWFVCEQGTIAIAAVDENNDVVGYAIGGPSCLARQMRRSMFWVTARSILFRPWLFLDPCLWKAGTIRLKNLFGPHGTLRSSDPPEPIMSLYGIGVALSHRNKGIGRQLLQVFEAKAQALGMRSLLLWVRNDKAATRRLYERCGWQLCQDPQGPPGVLKYVRLMD